MKYIFAGSAFAEANGTMVHEARLVTAETAEQARSVLMKKVLESHPKSEGWANHSIAVLDVPLIPVSALERAASTVAVV